MTDKEIRALIEKRRKDWRYGNSVEAKYKAEECDDILELMDEQEEPVSKDLEKASKFYAATHTEWFDHEGNPNVAPAFKAGANYVIEIIEQALTPQKCLTDIGINVGPEALIKTALQTIEQLKR